MNDVVSNTITTAEKLSPTSSVIIPRFGDNITILELNTNPINVHLSGGLQTSELSNSHSSAEFSPSGIEDVHLNEVFKTFATEGTTIKQWKLVESFSSKVIDVYDEFALVECLIDKENGIYQEKEILKSSFEDFEFKVGKVFKLCTFKRRNQMMVEIIDNPHLVAESDFPTIDFETKYKGFSFKKKRG